MLSPMKLIPNHDGVLDEESIAYRIRAELKLFDIDPVTCVDSEMVNERGILESNGAGDVKETYNIFRDSLLRYVGYANEIGESFRYQFPRLVTPSYVVAFGYCFADAATSGYKSYEDANGRGSRTSAIDAAISSMDVMIWQSLASVMIPGATINMIVKASRFSVSRSPFALPAMFSTWAPTAIGLSSIPLIVHPIDAFVDLIMDSSYRQIDFAAMLGDTSRGKGN